MKPIPEPVYPCKHCADEYSWPATDLFWSNQDQDWVCDDCWDDRDIEEEKGVCLADEIKKSEAKHDAEVIDEAIKYMQKYYPSLCVDGVFTGGWLKALRKRAKQLRQKTQETTK